MPFENLPNYVTNPIHGCGLRRESLHSATITAYVAPHGGYKFLECTGVGIEKSWKELNRRK
jgi:hypothetical protein